ncbi:uncharacterized protein [Gossypium hirsutum]|uniref:Uncharacterized protein n=1 Tax=Gossypium hirsutum TaxID=3635 RepID=A0ABM3A286_GOSHI|nr:uncharacterized protein LOC121217180 [Gossypium hirsutum]
MTRLTWARSHQPVTGSQQPPRGHGQARGGNSVGRGRRVQGKGVGSTHSYIACTVSGTLGIMCESTVNEMIVLSPLGQSVRVDKLFSDVPLEVQGVIFSADLMELLFGELNLILGMGWLDEEVAMIGERRDFLSNVISALRVEKLVHKGCEISEQLWIFSNVFPDELPRLSPSRKVEIGIELLPGAAPVSIAPYRMAPKELVELKA